MPKCIKCNATIVATATRCSSCGASLTQRIAKGYLATTTPQSTPSQAAQSGGSSAFYLLIAACVLAVIVAVVAYRYFTAPRSIEVEPGIRVAMPSSWREIRTDRTGRLVQHEYRGEIGEKVMLSLMIGLDAPMSARSKEVQLEGITQMAEALRGNHEMQVKVVDISQGDVVHVRADLDDTKILATPSKQLASNDFKHVRMGTIVKGANFIHYTISYDETNEAYQVIGKSIGSIAASP